nr:hypothetical protein [Tanacetum cinerariifolium]
MCEMFCQIVQKKQEEKRIEEEQAANARYWKIPACCDDDDDYDSAITPILSTEETDNSLSIEDDHLDTIPAMESDEVIKSSVEDLVPVQFLGHMIDNQGLAGYYRRFIEGFSKVARPMTKLTQRKVKFDWGEKQEAAFQLLKQKLCSASILALPEGSEDFILKIHEKNYTTHDLELRAVVFTLKTWRHYLKANVVADTLSRKEREPPLRVQALVMTIGLELPRQNLNAQTEARKPENIKEEDVG